MNSTIIALVILVLIVLAGCDKESQSIITQDKIDCQNICDNESLNLRYISTTKEILYCHCEKIITVEVEK